MDDISNMDFTDTARLFRELFTKGFLKNYLSEEVHSEEILGRLNVAVHSWLSEIEKFVKYKMLFEFSSPADRISSMCEDALIINKYITQFETEMDTINKDAAIKRITEISKKFEELYSLKYEASLEKDEDHKKNVYLLFDTVESVVRNFNNILKRNGFSMVVSLD